MGKKAQILVEKKNKINSLTRRAGWLASNFGFGLCFSFHSVVLFYTVLNHSGIRLDDDDKLTIIISIRNIGKEQSKNTGTWCFKVYQENYDFCL